MSKAQHLATGARAFVRGTACVLALAACKPASQTGSEPPENPLARQLAGARFDAAEIALEKNHRDEALLLLASSLKADPTFPDALKAIRELLAETHWHYPAAKIDVEIPIEQLAVSGNSLWTSVSSGKGTDDYNATARWNVETLTVESVLFPRPAEATRTLSLSPDGSKLIVERGQPGNFRALLCDAQSLKPIADLGKFPESLNLTAFSANGLLLGHPESEGDSLVWHIRDTSSGDIIRSANDAKMPQPVSARLGRDTLKVIHADGSALQIPISPLTDPLALTGEPIPENSSAFQLTGQSISFPDGTRAPVRCQSKITAAAIEGERLWVATETGDVEMHKELPLPKTTGRGMAAVRFKPSALKTLDHLAEALSSLHFDEISRTFTPLSEAQRWKHWSACKPADLATMFTGLDFSELQNTVLKSNFQLAAPNAGFLLQDRISRAKPGGPRYLALANTSPSTPSADENVRQLFQNGDSDTLTAAIRSLPPKSPALATALALALDSDQPEWIKACVESAPDLPPFLNRLAFSRIAWLEKRKPDAIAIWRNGFPDIEKIRRSEDWDGWESADFEARFTELATVIRQEVSAFEVADDASPADRAAQIKRLLDPSATRSIGREKHAAACLSAAEAAADFPDEIDEVFKLTVLARELGASPTKCLRTEAFALTAKGDFGRAHECWISLISDYPIETHLSRDYAEAAYTAFENGNEPQAMSILGTGLTHFPRDADFAYRAGWISLLTTRYREAYEFLRAGSRIGFPSEKHEKATALLAIAASASGDSENAEKFYDQLLAINPEWSAPEPPKAADWPDELKLALRQITEPPKAIPIIDEE